MPDDLLASHLTTPQDLAALACPTLLLYGESSDILDRARGLATAIRGSELHVIEGCSHALLMGVPARRADELLNRVGLADAARKKIGKYSLGMRQRLGLAHALMANPPLLMLDEPINGLDPVGIRAVRELLRGHAAQGGTALLSSHVLSEVDQTADRIVMIGHGRVVADGPIRQLLASNRSLVRGPDMQALANALMAAGVRIQPGPDGQILADAPSDRVSDIVHAAGVRVHGIGDHQQNLEELFFRLSGGGR